VSRISAASSAERKRERSPAANGFGPLVMAPALRRSLIRLRVASVMPMASSVNGLPLGPIVSAPAFTARAASGTSAVTTTLPGPARSAI
jgi:hypothetical protein